ncbi:MAG: CRP-like cAMP-binding protein [Sulfurimonas sp.]|jgi:CRP-like cAMP-binding protein
MMSMKLQKIDMFKDLDEVTLRTIEKFTTKHTVLKDNIIFYEGDEAKSLYLLASGIIKLYKTSSTNKEIVLKYFHENELIGEVANFEQIPYPATAKAYRDVEIIKIDFEKLKGIIYSNPELAFIIQTSLIKKIKTLETIISTNLVLDSKERVAKYLYKNSKDFFITKNIIIAEILSISPETLSRILKFFKDEEIIDMKAKKIKKDALLKYFE